MTLETALHERVARAIDPVAWRWIDKVRVEEPEHIALPWTLGHQLEQARRAIGAMADPRTCPFDDKTFEMDPKKPCPVCGDFGTVDAMGEPSRCVSRAAR